MAQIAFDCHTKLFFNELRHLIRNNFWIVKGKYSEFKHVNACLSRVPLYDYFITIVGNPENATVSKMNSVICNFMKRQDWQRNQPECKFPECEICERIAVAAAANNIEFIATHFAQDQRINNKFRRLFTRRAVAANLPTAKEKQSVADEEVESDGSEFADENLNLQKCQSSTELELDKNKNVIIVERERNSTPSELNFGCCVCRTFFSDGDLLLQHLIDSGHL